MARTDAIVLGAGIVGTSAALHLAKRGLAVTLVDRRGAGRGDVLRQRRGDRGQHALSPRLPVRLRRAASDRAQAGAGGELSSVVPAEGRALAAGLSRPTRGPKAALQFAEAMRPLFSRAVSEHEALMAEAGATRYLRKDGWLKLYRSDESFAATARERDYAAELGLTHRALEQSRRRARSSRRSRRCSATPCIGRMRRACPIRSRSPRPMRRSSPSSAASSSRAMRGRCIARVRRWRVETDEGPIDAKDAVVALGPWAPDLLGPLGIKLPLAFKRGYHRHFRSRGNAGLTRPVVDTD